MFEILFQNSFLTLRSLNIALALGFLFAGIFSIRYVEKHKMNLSFLTGYFLQILLALLIGGRLFYVLENLSSVRNNPMSILYIWDLNFSFFGLLAGAGLMLYYLTKKEKEDFFAWIDVAVLTTFALLIFAHIGFFLAGKNYGLPTDLPWGIVFEARHIPFVSPLHPTQLYAVLLTIILLMYSVKSSKRIHLSGVVGTKALMLYSLGMIGINYLQGAPSLYEKLGYAGLAIISFVAYVHCTHKTHVTT